MLIDSIVIGVLAGWLFGGKIGNLKDVEIRKAWVIFLAFVLQYSGIFLLPVLYDKQLISSPYFYSASVMGSYLILIVFSLYNRKQPGFYWVVVGMALNLLVMLANGGRMPVELTAAQDLSPADVPALVGGTYGKHIAMSNDTNLNFLGDLIYLQAPYPHHTIVSLGDIVFSIGVIIFIITQMGARKIMFRGSKKHEIQ